MYWGNVMRFQAIGIFRSFAAIMIQFAVVSSCFAVDLYDATADFSSTINTNTSVWSYRYREGTTRDGVYTLLPNYGPAGGGWSSVNPGTWSVGGDNPQVGANKTGFDATFTPVPSFVWPNGTMLMHPGANGMAIVSWLSPSSTTVTIQFGFVDLDSNDNDGVQSYVSDGVDWFVERNSDAYTLASGTIANGGGTGTLTLSDVSVSPGDRINFLIAPKSTHLFDSTQFNAVISTVPIPEPSTYVLSTLAALTLAILARRKRRTVLA